MLNQWKYELESGFILKETLQTSENPVQIVKQIDNCYNEMLDVVDLDDFEMVESIKTNKESLASDIIHMEESLGEGGRDMPEIDDNKELQILIAMLVDMRLKQFVDLCDDGRFLIKH